MGPLESVVLEEGPPTLAAGTLTGNDVQVRAWYVSKNGSYAFVTYTGDLPLDTDELCVCERIVRSIEFEVHNETQR